MALLRNLMGSHSSASDTRASVESPTTPLSSAALLQVLGGDSLANTTGVRVNEQNAWHNSAVWRAVTLVSGICGYLPLAAYKSGSFTPLQNNLIKNPHPEMTSNEFWSLTATHRALWGNFYAQKMMNGAGAVQWLNPIDPSTVKVTAIKTGPYAGKKLFAITMPDGTTEPFTSNEIFHVPHWMTDGVVGVSPIRAMRLAVGISIAAEQYAGKLFGSGNLATGILQTEQRLEQKDAEKLKQKWEEKMSGMQNAHSTVVLDSGATFHQLTMPNSDAQFLQSRQFQILEIGRFFGVPPFLLMETERATSWGTGLEQQALGWVTFDMGPRWLCPLEARLTKELTGAGNEARYDMNKLLRGDSAAMGSFFRIMREIGVFNADEIREEIGREPLPDGQGKIYLMPANMQSLSGSDSKIDPSVGADQTGPDGKPDGVPDNTIPGAVSGKAVPSSPTATPTPSKAPKGGKTNG
jgi:HK97 family phage portal protein